VPSWAAHLRRGPIIRLPIITAHKPAHILIRDPLRKRLERLRLGAGLLGLADRYIATTHLLRSRNAADPSRASGCSCVYSECR
jgi:hypothetical protein